MAKKWAKFGVVALASSAMLFQNVDFSITPASAATASTSSIASKIVKLNASAYMNIRDVHMMMQGKGKVLVYSVSITNNSNSSLDLIDYWLRVKTKSGKSFKTTIIDADKDVKDVPAKTTQYLTYYTVVDNQTKLTDLTFQVVKWDFSTANYERVLGNIQYPSNGTDKIAPFKDSVMLYDNNKIRSAIKQSYITTDANNAYLVVNLLVENVGFQSSDLSKMNFFVQTDSNSVYNVTASGLDQTTIQPKERKIVTLHATIPLAVASKALSLVVAQNDDATKIQLPVGVYSFPTTKPLAAAAVGKTRLVYLAGSPTNTIAGQAFVSQGTSSKDLSMEFKLTNIGTASIANPALDYFIVTSSGTSYPLSYEKEENGTLLPNIEKTVSLSGQVPTNVSLTNAQLVVKSQATEKEKSYIIGTYALQSTTQQGSLGGSFIYNNDFTVKLNTIQRAPSSDNDVLVATLSVTNRSAATVHIPSIGGYFMVNGVKVGTEQKSVAMDDSVTIAPGASTDFVVYSSIPYTTAIDKITFVSTETVQDKAGKQLYQFSAQTLSDIPFKKLDEVYSINGIGKRSTINVLRTAVFDGTTKNNFYAEFEAVNNELRSAPLATLGGYIVDKNGIVVPVTFATVKDKLSPNGKALLSAYAAIPKSFDTSSYKLILGQSIGTDTSGSGSGGGTGGTGGTGGSGTGTGGTDTGGVTESPVLVNMVSYSLNAFTPVTSADLGSIPFAGYTFGMHYINAFLNVVGQYDVNGLKMTFDYDLEKNQDYEIITGDHKLLIEFINQDTNHVTYSKQFSLETGSDTEQALTISKNNPFSIVFTDSDIQTKIQKYDTYKVNVYDVFQNSKLLLASKTMNWFTTTP
ncbi:LEA type 2 family protein [Paenibacillus sacheonensis]|uniref:Uncharacterized protein n=1 Tax=Paenibacillus sacheonensis TaxID=742054 RepID=A0A7X5C274_9BACL|nr:LEA type 2 family protein [Paenibacillus sacheonensis]MBM7566494.1 hypothetical protein [Paenibacillus sacheonensis]NBC73562.1 hypothetical protein [Paenibacillus sacheonensis]